MKKIISIIIATYNRAEFISETLNSLRNQTFTDWEVIIVDDGGNDNTSEVLEPFLSDHRFCFYKRPIDYPKGCPGSRNFGLTKAQGDLVWFFDDDDIAHPNLLQTCVELLQEKKLDFCRFERKVFYNPDTIDFDQKNSPKRVHVDKSALKDVIIGNLPFNSCQVIWRRSSLGEKKFRADIIYADDWQFYTHLISYGLEGISTSNVLLFARKHSGSATHKYKAKNKTILNSVTLATFSVIDLARQENILDRQLFKFFYRQALFFHSYPIVEYLLEKADLKPLEGIKYRLGFHFYPILQPLFKIKGNLKNDR